MEEALRESRERFESAFEYAAIGMGLVAPDGRWLRVNRALCETLGYAEEGLLSKTIRSITHPDDLGDLEQVERLLDGEIETYSTEKRYVRKDGQTVWVLLSVSAVHDDRGKVLYLISQVQDITERKALEEKLARLAYHDALTGLPNRALLEERMGHALERAGMNGSHVAILYLDLDGFKEVNDSFGHESGDRLLVEFARRIRLHSRPTDSVARLGGDEFCVLLEGFRNPEEAARVANRLRERLTVPFDLGRVRVRVGVSIGIATSGPHDENRTVGQLLCEADAEMYRRKKLAKSRASEGAYAGGFVAGGSGN